MIEGNESRQSRQSLARSFAVAWDGIREGWRMDRNLRIHGGATLLVIAVSLWLQLTASEWALIVLTCGLVWSAELFNTAIEAVVDRISPERHELARIAKDTASGGCWWLRSPP